MKYVHDISGTPIFAEVARKAIKDEYGNDINETYLKKKDITYQYNENNEIIAINNSAIAAGGDSKKIVGEDGIYVRNDLTAYVVGVSADYAYNSALSSKQDKLTEDQITDINSIPFKLDKTEFAEVSADFATKDYVDDKISDLGSPLVIRGSKTCAEINALTGMKVGDVYCVKDSGTIDGQTILARDEVAWTSDNTWIIVGRENAADLTDYYKKTETSGKDEISTALQSLDDNFENYYPKSSTSGSDQISQALASKTDTSALDYYYLKTETSSKEEIDNALLNKVNNSALESYVTNETLANNYYDKTETDNLIESGLSSKVDYEYLQENYYNTTEVSSKDEVQNALADKLDTTAFNTVSSTFLTDSDLDGYATTAELNIASGTLKDGVDYISGVVDNLDIPTHQEIKDSSAHAYGEATAWVDTQNYINSLPNSSNWNNTYTAVTSNSSNWNESYITLTSNSANWEANVQSDWNETNSANDSYIKNKPDIYTKTEIDSLFNGKIVIVDSLPASGETGKIYYVGPFGTGDDKYDEYIWNGSWVKVGEHTIDLSDYATIEYVDSINEDKLDTSAIQGANNVITGINGSAIKDTVYSQGDYITITNNTINGKDWSTEITSATSGKAESSDVEDLAGEMAQGFADMDERKVDVSSFNSLEDIVEGIVEELPDKQDKLSGDVQDALDQVYTNSGDWNYSYLTLTSNSSKWEDTTSAYQINSGTYLTTADSAEFYTMTGNPSGFMSEMFFATYGQTSYEDIKSAYNAHKIVYCYVPNTTGNRMAFLAFVGTGDSGNFEFQYYRSLTPGKRPADVFGDELYTYIRDTRGWQTGKRYTCNIISAGDGLYSTYTTASDKGYFTLNLSCDYVDAITSVSSKLETVSANAPLSGDGTSANPLGVDMNSAYTIDGAYGITTVPDTATNKVVVQMTNDVYQDVQTVHSSISAWNDVSGLSAKSTVSANTANVISISSNSTATPVEVSATTYYTNTADNSLKAQKIFVVQNDADLINHAGLANGQGCLFFVLSGFQNN